jgi:hypothetical protein
MSVASFDGLSEPADCFGMVARDAVTLAIGEAEPDHAAVVP